MSDAAGQGRKDGGGRRPPRRKGRGWRSDDGAGGGRMSGKFVIFTEIIGKDGTFLFAREK
jgi:hypothetical protein